MRSHCCPTKLSRIEEDGNQAINYYYDNADGTLAQVIDGAATTSYSYTANKKLASVTYDFTANGLTALQEVSYTYYPDGLTETMTWKSGGATVAAWSYCYDGVGRITSVTNNFGETTSYTYDNEGKLLTQSNQTGTSLTYGYNQSRSWPTLASYAFSGVPFASYSLGYDQGANTVGNLTNVSELDGSVQVFTYDDLDRLTAEARTGTVPFTRSYAYDLANNVTQVDSSAFATYDAGNKISSLTGGTISFDGNGRLRSLSHPTIGNGSFIWNSSDKMTSQTVSGVTSTYKYDHRGLRLVSFQGSEGQWVYYVFSGDQLIGEVLTSGNQKAYTWGADGIVSTRDVASNTSRWLHYGPQGETKYLTNSSGTITDSYNYSAYGVLTATTGSSYNPFRYGGKVGYYSHGGLILAGQRWYHPGLMRWLSRDPILYAGGDNVYVYVEGNPVGWIDPDGLAPFTNSTDKDVPYRPEDSSGGLDPLKKYNCPPGQTCDVDGVYPNPGDYPYKICDDCEAEGVKRNGECVITKPKCKSWAAAICQWWYGGTKDKDFMRDHKDWPRIKAPVTPHPSKE